MYTLVKAYGVKKAINSLWGDQDLTGLKLFELFQLYRQLYLELSNPFLAENVYVDMMQLDWQYQSSEQTLEELFQDQPNLSLDTVSQIPLYETKKAFYMDAFRANYKVYVNTPGQKPDSNTDIRTKTEIAIYREGTSPKDIHDYCLLTVNGYLHRTDHDDKYCYVTEGGSSWLKSRQNTCGISSFERIGKVHKVPFDLDQISKTSQDSLLSDQFFLQIPDAYKNMAIMLSIGGYLVTPTEEMLTFINDDTYVVNANRLQYIERYLESRNFINTQSLELTEFGRDKDKFSITELLSDEVYRRYLQLPQSFLIAVETDSLVFQRQYLRHRKLANKYIAYHNPTDMMFLGRGRAADYWKNPDEELWDINVPDGYRPRYTHEAADLHSYDSGTNTPYKLYDNSRAYLLEIMSDKKVY